MGRSCRSRRCCIQRYDPFLLHLVSQSDNTQVIGERVVSPSAIVYLVVKLRLKSLIAQAPQDDKKPELDVDAIKRRVKRNDEQEEEFLKSRGDAEESKTIAEYAHAPHWPGVCFLSFFARIHHLISLSLFQERKPSWWIVLADEKSNRIVVPPLKITDIPNTRLPNADADEALLEHDYRAYKIQFQSPPNVGMFTWKVYVVSDTFVGGEVTRDITVSISLSRVSVYY